MEGYCGSLNVSRRELPFLFPFRLKSKARYWKRKKLKSYRKAKLCRYQEEKMSRFYMRFTSLYFPEDVTNKL